MAYEKVTPGQRIKATPFSRATFMNDTVDLVNAFNEGRLTGGRRPTAGSGSRVVVEVRNSTGADRVRGEVVQLVGHLLTDVSADHPWFDAELCADAVLHRIAILTQALKEDEIGPAQMLGVCLARVDVTSTSHTHAMPVDGESELASSFTGPLELLMVPEETGVQDLWALIRPDQTARVAYIVESGGIALDASGTVELYVGAPGSETATGIEFEAYNGFGDLDEGARTLCHPIGPGWHIGTGTCPA
jgi:hypothetical protein